MRRLTAGPPTKNRTVRNRNGSPELRYFYGATKTKVIFETVPGVDDWVVQILTTRRGVERTADGSGVGTPRRVLRKRIPGLKCIKPSASASRRAASSTRSAWTRRTS